MTPPFRTTLTGLVDAAWTLAAVSAAVECGLVSRLGAPTDVRSLAEDTDQPEALIARLVEVLAGVGLVRIEGSTVIPSPEALEYAGGGLPALVLRDELRRTVGQSRALIDDARAGRLAPGWRHVDPDVIHAQGTFAVLQTRLLFVEGIIPRCEGLADALAEPGASVLDVGSGAAGNAIAFARAWPAARIVGLEPWAESMRIGRANVARAGLEARIDLRAERVEDLADAETYTLVWLPQMFLDAATLPSALDACVAALRPGGWLMTAWIAEEDTPGLPAALARLRDVAFGGEARGPDTLTALLRDAGLEDVRRFALGGLGAVAARRPE